MKFYVGITDYDWFKIIKQSDCDEVSLWRPSGNEYFRALEEGELFLFKLHSPRDFIVGGGIFHKFFQLPPSLAWQAFGIANGANTYLELYRQVYKSKRSNPGLITDNQIGCIILSSTFYLKEEEWIPIPNNWNKNIAQGMIYDTTEAFGGLLYQQVQERLNTQKLSLNTKPRLGLGSFKTQVVEAYHRRCAVTGKNNLPLLQATQIKPHSFGGPHEVNNGILLRSDFHILFELGYMTIDKRYNIEISRHIREDFSDAEEYYSYHGSTLTILPERLDWLPNPQYLEWHNENVFISV